MYALCTRYARLFRNFQESRKKCKKSSEIRRFRNFPGGDKRDRTADLLNAIQALSRLVRLHTPLNRVKRALQYAGDMSPLWLGCNFGIFEISHKHENIISISDISRKRTFGFLPVSPVQ